MKKTLIVMALSTLIAISFAFTKVVNYSVDVEKSTVTWTGKKIAYGHYGTIRISSGTLAFSGNDLTGGNFIIDMTSMVNQDIEDENKNAKLIGHLKSEDFFNTSEYSTSELIISSVQKRESNEGNYEIIGNLTIKGITHPVTFPARVTVNDDIVSASANIVFDRSKYNVRYGSGSFFDDLGDKMIFDDIEIKVDLVASKYGSSD